MILVSIYDPFKKLLEQYVSITILALMIFFLIISLIIGLFYIFHLKRQLKPNLILALGVYWDKKVNPYCPSCKTLLSNYGFYDTGSRRHPGMKCIKCNIVIHFSDETKIFYELKEAKQFVQAVLEKN